MQQILTCYFKWHVEIVVYSTSFMPTLASNSSPNEVFRLTTYHSSTKLIEVSANIGIGFLTNWGRCDSILTILLQANRSLTVKDADQAHQSFYGTAYRHDYRTFRHDKRLLLSRYLTPHRHRIRRMLFAPATWGLPQTWQQTNKLTAVKKGYWSLILRDLRGSLQFVSEYDKCLSKASSAMVALVATTK